MWQELFLRPVSKESDLLPPKLTGIYPIKHQRNKVRIKDLEKEKKNRVKDSSKNNWEMKYS